MKIFITGGSGFIGRVLVKRLISDGNEVIALSRTLTSSHVLKELGASVCEGDLENLSNLSLEGIDTVIHVAAPVQFHGNWEFFNKGIVESTYNLLKNAASYHVKKFIFISSEAVLQKSSDLFDIDESYPYPDQPNSYYGKAKMLAEQIVLSEPTPMECMVIRPPFVWGKEMPALETFISKIKSNQFIWIDEGKAIIEHIHVENLAEGVLRVLENGKDNEIYNITDHNPMPIKKIITALVQTKGIQIADKSIPSWLLIPFTFGFDFIWKLFDFSFKSPISKFDVAFMAMNRRYKTDKAINELKYKPIINFEEGISKMKE